VLAWHFGATNRQDPATHQPTSDDQMTFLIDQMADLTSYRDREQADALLLDMLGQVLQPLSLALHHCVGEAHNLRWRTTVHRPGSQALDATSRVDYEHRPALARQPEWVECLRDLRVVERAGPPALALMPIVVNSLAVGVVEVRSAAPLTEERRRSAQAIVRLYGNYRALLDYGERDPLTGLFNRKKFNDSFMRAVVQRAIASSSQQAGNAGEPSPQYFLAAVDLDHFKQINDSFGYFIGDEVLLLTARVMRTVLGCDDRLFRFGGEEFAVLLDAADEKEALAVLQDLREQVARHKFPQVGHVMVSIGFTAVRPSDLPTSAIERADRALHLAKAKGRNCVVGPATMVPAGLLEVAARGGSVDLFDAPATESDVELF
jgi:diguanylate cyclase (GGDEF)-like protein